MIDRTAEEIRAMQTHSSSVVAVKATRALEELLEREYESVDAYHRALEQNANVLRRANPSHASLQTAIRSVVNEILEEGDHASVEAAQAATAETIDRVVEQIERAKHGAAKNALPVLPDGATVLTHDYSSTVMRALELAVDADRSLSLYVTEARPRFIGRKMARQVAELDGVDVTLITDAACGQYLQECDRVLVGMSSIVDETLYNRVGTFPIAATAAQLDVPVSSVGAATKVIKEGFVFENEYRPSSEVLLEPAEGFDIANPAYDGTPIALLDSIITDDGVREP